MLKRYFHMFPYELVERGSKIILYGAGEVGRTFAQQLLENRYCEIVAIVDKNHENVKLVAGIEVHSPKVINELTFDKVVVAVRNDKKSILKDLSALGVAENIVVSGEYSCYEDGRASSTIEADIVSNVFMTLGIDKPSYIDVGACHPHRASNTMSFYEAGSRGINIEPNIDLRKEFEEYRPEDTNLFIGVSCNSGEGKFYKSENVYLSSFSVPAIEWAKTHHNAKYNDYVVVPLMTLNEVVEKYADGVFPDFLDIDVEGLDAEILRSTDFSKSSPKVILVEGSPKAFNEILMDKDCEGGGYTPYCIISYNTIYLRNDVMQKLLF